MVKGIDIFRDSFTPFKDQYIIIGGTACDLLHDVAGLPFRVTKDLDIVLCVDVLQPAFVQALWKFVKEGGYERKEESSGRPQFFRFSDPKQPEYPNMLELFAPSPDGLPRPEEARFTRIPTSEEVSSLSAILLDEEYYGFLRSGVREVSGISIAGPEHLIPLKARAFLDLTKRKNAGGDVDQKHITKHKNDVFRVYRIVDPERTLVIPAVVRSDMREFLQSMDGEAVDLRSLGINTTTKDDILSDLNKRYCS